MQFLFQIVWVVEVRKVAVVIHVKKSQMLTLLKVGYCRKIYSLKEQQEDKQHLFPVYTVGSNANVRQINFCRSRDPLIICSFDLISESYLTILYHFSAKCIIVKGHSTSMRREDLKKVKSREECVYLVAYTRPTASGMTFRTRDKNCWAEFGTTGTNGHNGYESCKFNRNFL